MREYICEFESSIKGNEVLYDATVKCELIRCKYCEHNESSSTAGNACCDKFYGMTDQMGFCHYGERREE